LTEPAWEFSSGTTPKLIANERDVRLIGYGSMALESLVAIMAMIAATLLDPGVYFAINVGALISQVAMPELRDRYDYATAFLFPAWLMVAALAVFAAGKRYYGVETFKAGGCRLHHVEVEEVGDVQGNGSDAHPVMQRQRLNHLRCHRWNQPRGRARVAGADDVQAGRSELGRVSQRRHRVCTMGIVRQNRIAGGEVATHLFHRRAHAPGKRHHVGTDVFRLRDDLAVGREQAAGKVLRADP
jgi:hypothetical protein